MKKRFLPVLYQNGNLLLLDQRIIPWEVVYVTCKNLNSVAEAIRNMTVRGAPALGITAAYAFKQFVNTSKCNSVEELMHNLNKVAEILISTRPTAVNIKWCCTRILNETQNAVGKVKGNVRELQNIVETEADKVVSENIETDRLICINGAKWFNKKKGKRYNILTHCNTGSLATGAYGTALGVVLQLAKEHCVENVFVDETRPYMQGARLTAWELQQHRVKHTLICDNMAGYFMSKKMVDFVIVGADRIAANGDTANKIGTYSLSILAKENNVPFYIAAPFSSIDLGMSNGKEIKIEYRSDDEVRKIRGVYVTSSDTSVLNPAFDVTPGKYITGIVTECGVIQKPYQRNLGKYRVKHLYAK
ncbi:MAG: S-methyl-5-thioribose-1-phosphate isomerase [Elusimicrobiota bacterium]